MAITTSCSTSWREDTERRRCGVPRSSCLLTGLDPALEAVTTAALARMANAGAVLVDVELPSGLQQ